MGGASIAKAIQAYKVGTYTMEGRIINKLRQVKAKPETQSVTPILDGPVEWRWHHSEGSNRAEICHYHISFMRGFLIVSILYVSKLRWLIS